MAKNIIVKSFLIFVFASFLMLMGTQFIIPVMSGITGWETIIWWFIVAGIFVFLPLIVIAWLLLIKEGVWLTSGWWKNRLRFQKLSVVDLIWGIGGIFVIGLFSWLIMEGIKYFFGPTNNQPHFMSFEPLSSGRYYILLFWLPYWLLNIFGEEILWRGVLLPQMEKAIGKYAWLLNGLFWAIFHIAFGWQLLLTLIPILLILPYIVQKRKNTWLGIIIHAAINGPSFLAISFGLI